MAVLAGLALPARADVVLHEFVEDDPVEDLRLGAMTSDGNMAAAIQTESGAIAAPNLEAPGNAPRVYGGNSGSRERGASYRVDSNTSQPDVVRYDDPFTPEITPFKREFAYDAVDERLELIVSEPALTRVETTGEARPEDDQFYGDITVDLLAGEPVRIPSVGPGARILGMRSSPRANIDVLRDGADNWFVRSKSPGRVRLAMQLAIDRGVFGSAFADTTWAELEPFVKEMPLAIRDEAAQVANRIGISEDLSPADAVARLVSHFRDFSPSDERPTSSGLALYRELVQSQKGVCRHRSFGFVITALAVGLPARMARNEAHAWVEVFDTIRWHRIDLGGAAGRVEMNTEGRAAHIAPRDPYVWPPDSDSGEGMAEQARASAPSGGTNRPAGSDSTSMQTSGNASTSNSGVDSTNSPDDQRPHSVVTLTLGAQSAVRGTRFPVFGTVVADGDPCSLARVDLRLSPKASTGLTETIALGALVTNESGEYRGHLVVPYRVNVGEYDVVASTPGSYRCGRGSFP